jgi:two-component system cell cycle sensor histidine kinase/response regulator CckA
LGKGTTFTLYFPRVRQPLEPARDSNTQNEASGGNETVLLVEDERIVRELAGYTLREKGYTVIEAGNGEEALRAAQQHGRIDLVFTDVIMPVMGGKEMADALRQSSPDTKFLFTSGYTEDAIGHHGLMRRDTEFLQKPYMTATLVRRIREVLDESPQ